MTQARLEYVSAATLLVVCALVGFPVLLYGDEILVVPAWLWWSCYFGYLLTMIGLFLSEAGRSAPIRRILQPGLIGLLAVLGAAIVLLAPGAGWTPILLVMTSAVAAQMLGLGPAIVILALNSVLVFVSGLMNGGAMADAAFGGMIYAALQACSVWAVYSNVREGQTRRELAAANVELRGATALLAESSRSTERLRIARELHDLVAHQLSALALELEVAAHRSSDPAAREHVRRGRDLAKELLNDVRGAVGELRTQPPELRSTLQSVTAKVPRPRVHLELDEELSPDEDRVTALIRCAQEVVTNAIRHAEADNVWIDVRTRDDSIVFDARDDGRGVSLLRLGNGLTGLRERVELLGGTVRFDAHDGFRVWASLPRGASS